MTEREIILNIIDRLGKDIIYKNDNAIEFRSFDGSILIEFDDNGLITDID
jgi:hypothetical protein